jgi:hypothetical protein
LWAYGLSFFELLHFCYMSNSFYIFFSLMTLGIRVSLRAPRLILEEHVRVTFFFFAKDTF